MKKKGLPPGAIMNREVTFLLKTRYLMIEKTSPLQAPAVAAPVDGRIMHQQESLEVILLTLQPGDSLPLHTNPFDVLFAGIKGSATLLTPHSTYSLQPGETLFVSSHEERAWHNNGTQPCQILVIKDLHKAC